MQPHRKRHSLANVKNFCEQISTLSASPATRLDHPRLIKTAFKSVLRSVLRFSAAVAYACGARLSHADKHVVWCLLRQIKS